MEIITRELWVGLPLQLLYADLIKVDGRYWRKFAWEDCTMKSGLEATGLNVTVHRSTIYDFLLSASSKHGPISYCFWDKQWFWSKIANFSPPMYFTSPMKRFLLELGIATLGQITRMMGLPGRERSLTIPSAVWAYMNMTDRRMDRQRDRRMERRTPGNSKDHAKASCGKNIQLQ